MKKTLLRAAGVLLLFNCYASYPVSTDNPPQESASVETEAYEPRYKVSKCRVAIDVGYSHRIGKAAEGVNKSDINLMRPGFHYGAEIHGFWDENGGIGVKAFGQHHSASSDYIKDRLNIFYIGPSIMFRSFDAQNAGAFIFAASLGYMHYDERVTVHYTELNASKGTLGSTIDFGYESRISAKTFIGVKLSLSAGVVKITPSDAPVSDEYKESLAAVNLSFGLRF